MRILVFFDLPTTTAAQRTAYAQFRRLLLKSGFMMMQESVYCKLALNQTATNTVVQALQRSKPREGLIEVLTITEKQFSKIQRITGDHTSSMLDTPEKLVVL